MPKPSVTGGSAQAAPLNINATAPAVLKAFTNLFMFVSSSLFLQKQKQCMDVRACLCLSPRRNRASVDNCHDGRPLLTHINSRYRISLSESGQSSHRRAVSILPANGKNRESFTRSAACNVLTGYVYSGSRKPLIDHSWRRLNSALSRTRCLTVSGSGPYIADTFKP